MRCCLALLSVIVCNHAHAEEVDLELRASWGGGEATAWAGTVAISSGSFTLNRVLGVEADSPGVIVPLSDNKLRIRPCTPHSYDGFDIQISAPRDAVLQFEFISPTNEASPAKFEVPIEQLIAGRFARELDTVGNRFAIHRTAGDVLRFSCEQDHLIFKAGQSLSLTLTPHLVPDAADITAKCSVRLVSVAARSTVWQQDYESTLDSEGNATAIEVSVDLPDAEGVYELVADLQTKPFGVPLVRPKTLAERQVQFVVLEESAEEPEPVDWSVVGEYDPAQPKLWDRIMRLPSMKIVPGFKKGPLGNEPTGTEQHLGVAWSTLQPNAWQAYPLPVGTPGQPHMLEVEFPSDVTQSLAISIVEPNAAGFVIPLGLDSGIDVKAVVGRSGELRVHRLPFWPRTKSPLVLLVNRRNDAQAIFGKIRVSTGPSQLAAGPINGESANQRLSSVYFDRPLFAENFSVAEALDTKSNRPIDDWSMFYSGATRMADYVKFAGHNAAVVSVLSEGSGLYPSAVLGLTPKYDMGAFSAAGNDPLRKDVLELLMQTFDRERLQLLPAVQFASPLPELEQLLATLPASEVEGIELVGPTQQPLADTTPSRRGGAPYYNLLDDRVQTAMRRVVLEIAERYAGHEAMAGLVIQISHDGYAQLPDDACALDNVTLARFASDCGLQLPPVDPRRPTARWEWIEREALDDWLNWRCDQVAAFYQAIREDLNSVRPNLKLILCPTEPVHSRRLAPYMRPTLPIQERTTEALLRAGLDVEKLGKIEGLSLSRSWHIEPGTLDGLNPIRSQWNGSPTVDRAVEALAVPAALQMAEALPLRLADFDKVSPFGAQNTHMYLLTHLAPVGPEARRRFVQSLARVDAQTILDGGQMLTLGQEDEVRDLLHAYRQIPPTRFETVPSETRTQPVVLRRWSGDNATWFYLVNSSAWPVVVDVELATNKSLSLTTMGVQNRRTSLPAASGVARWKVRLRPYDLVVAEFEQPDLVARQWRTQVDRTVDVALHEELRELRRRSGALRAPAPLESLKNAGFEEGGTVNSPIPHWTSETGTGITAELDSRHSKQGGASLRVASRAMGGEKAPVVWVRSDTIEPPTTGRLALWAQLKVADASRQPVLRLAIEGKLDGQPYYRRANVGASEDGRRTEPLKTEWSPFLFAIDDLPAEGLIDLQVGFDLMNEGEVWIDDVQVFDLLFEKIEKDALSKSLALADFQIQEGQYSETLGFLDSYWPQFLRRHVAAEEAQVAVMPERPASPTELPPSKQTKTPDGKWRWMPRWPFQK